MDKKAEKRSKKAIDKAPVNKKVVKDDKIKILVTQNFIIDGEKYLAGGHYMVKEDDFKGARGKYQKV